MMVGLFLINLVAQFFLYQRKKNLAFALLVLNGALAIAMLLHHATTTINIRL